MYEYENPLKFQKEKVTKLFYFSSLLSMILFVMFGIATGMDILPSLIGIGLVLPIGLVIFIWHKFTLAGVYLFLITNLIATGIAVYFGGFFSNTIYFIPIIFAFSIYILPGKRAYLIITCSVLVSSICLLWFSQGTSLNRYFFKGLEFQKVMAFTMLIAISILIIVTKSYYDLLQRLIEKLLVEKRKAEASDFERKKLLSILFHDLANNLTASLYRLRPEKLGLDKSSDSFKNANVGHDNLQKMKELLSHVKELEKAKGNNPLELSKVSLNTIVNESLTTFNFQINEKGLFIKLDLKVDYVITNAQTLQFNILNNLLSNAVKFSKRGSGITISSRSYNDGFMLSVSNPGENIPLSISETIFDINQQASSLGTNGERGNGFGLAIASEMAKKLGGCLELSQDKGEIAFSFIQI